MDNRPVCSMHNCTSEADFEVTCYDMGRTDYFCAPHFAAMCAMTLSMGMLEFSELVAHNGHAHNVRGGRGSDTAQ